MNNDMQNTTNDSGIEIPSGDIKTETGAKTFSQDDVNRIVSERLQKERQRADNALVEREKELQQRELLLTAKEKLSEQGLPFELLEALNTSSEEALDKSLKLIKEHIDKNTNQPKFVGVTHADGLSGSPVVGNNIRQAMGLD